MATQGSGKKNPVIGFLIMAGFNVLAAMVFILFFILTSRGEWGGDPFWMLVAGLVNIATAGLLLGAYVYFKKKLNI